MLEEGFTKFTATPSPPQNTCVLIYRDFARVALSAAARYFCRGFNDSILHVLMREQRGHDGPPGRCGRGIQATDRALERYSAGMVETQLRPRAIAAPFNTRKDIRSRNGTRGEKHRLYKFRRFNNG